MIESNKAHVTTGHSHVFLGTGHEQNERKTWAVIFLCGAMMLVEIIGGSMFGSLALVADGLHMSTHAGAMLIAALAYTYARRHVHDSRFVFGTGKLGDLAGFSSAIILAMIALLIGYEAVSRILAPVPIHFKEAIPIAVVGLLVNIASAWLLSGGEHHDHNHGHDRDRTEHDRDDGAHQIATKLGNVEVSIFEHGTPPRFRVSFDSSASVSKEPVLGLETRRSDGQRQHFSFVDRGAYWESVQEIPEPHAFIASVHLADGFYDVIFEEHVHEHPGDDGGAAGGTHRDYNIRSAYIHVMADAVVSVMAITGLVLARTFGWLWMDPLAGIIGALVIGNWSYGLVRDTGRILLDMNSDQNMCAKVRAAIERDGDELVDLHLWRLGPGHLGAVLSVITGEPRDCRFYRARLSHLKNLSHITIEVVNSTA
jgi:cation diffusion facilitator family transporter